MAPGDWIITSTGALLALAGLSLLAWALLADRLRTRRDRKQGALRRCPRCWYDMSAVAGLRCPECGREAERERTLHRSRRRWRWAIVAALVMAAGAGAIAYPHARGGAWHRWVPATALLLVIRHSPEPVWAAEELAQRLGLHNVAPMVRSGRELDPWQWELLADACARAIERDPSFSSQTTIFWMTLYTSPRSDRALDGLLESLKDENTQSRLLAAMTLDRTRFFFTDEQLERIRDAIAATPELDAFDERQRQFRIQAMDRQIRSRSGDWRARLEDIDAMPLTPDAIMHALNGRSINDLVALHRRTRTPRSMLVDTDETLPDAMAAERIDLRIDDDDLDDCIILTWNRNWQQGGSNIHYEAFVLLQTSGSGWRFLGCMDLSNCLLGPPRFHTVEAANGSRWLVMRRDNGVNLDGSYFIMQDAWYRVRGGRLVLEQALLPRGFSNSRFHQTLEPAEPNVLRRGGRYLASYDIASTISLAVPGADGSERLVPIAEEQGTFEYPLGVADSNLGKHVPPGPWQGRDCWWAILEDPDILTVYKPELLALARSDDPEVRAALRAVIEQYLTFLAPTPEIAEIQRALDEP